MKKMIHPSRFLSCIGMVLLCWGCTDDCNKEVSYIYYKPVYTTTEEIRSSFDFQQPEEISFPGKIYLLGNFLFVNEISKGIHIIDNSDAANPVNVGFVNIPGNHDMAARGNILYADSYIDLLAIDISDMNDIKVVKRMEGVFNDHYYMMEQFNDQGEAVLVTYEEIDTTFTDMSDCNDVVPSFLRFGGINATMDKAYSGALSYSSETNFFTPVASAGLGGSMARFAIVNDKLYTAGTYYLQVFDIATLSDPVKGAWIDLGWGIETIFPYENNLFIGANNGMHIYDISDPESPVHVSTFAHVTSCDPVVVQDTLAFVTLRSGTECQGYTNQLDVLNIKNLYNPTLIKSYPMKNPHGLGIDGKALFICEGEFGLKVFDSRDIFSIDQHMVKNYPDIHAFDVIPFNDILIMIGEDGLFQYDYTHLENMKLLSTIPIVREE
ncbi:MAG: hypothetical protein KFF73_07610 [Cyclobacteriaceae bacterium]|nr:hypothetical protein [Cyclobacteriaceae bacterium]